MELRQLRSLIAIEETGGFTRAAKAVHLAQPALSQQVARLEAELGVALVDRTTRRVHLTEAGRRLTTRARAAFRELDGARAEIDALRGLTTGTLTIGMTPTPGRVDLAALLGTFHAAHPDVRLSLREGLTTDLVDGLRRDVLDLAIITGEVAVELDHRELSSEPLVVVVGHGHRWAERKRLQPRDLAFERLVTFRPGAIIRTTLERRASREAWQLDIAFEVDDPRRVIAVVAAGLGVGVLPVSDAATSAVAAVPLAGPDLRHRVSLAWRAARRQPPAAAAFLATSGMTP